MVGGARNCGRRLFPGRSSRDASLDFSLRDHVWRARRRTRLQFGGAATFERLMKELSGTKPLENPTRPAADDRGVTQPTSPAGRKRDTASVDCRD